MLIGLTADLHLEKRLGVRTDERGVNLRTRDFEKALSQVIDGFIRTRVKVGVIAGDLFDHPKPSERTRQFVVGEMRRLEEAGIVGILLRGNHDAPMIFTDATAIGTAALALPNAIIADAHQVVQHVIDDVAFTLVPWMRSDSEFLTAIEGLTPIEGKHNLLILHSGMADLPEYAEMRPGSQTLTRSLIPHDRFDWIFSGHFHGRRTIADLRWTFIGSAERVSVTEVYQDEKGFITYESAVGGQPGITFHAVKTRPWYDLKTLDGSFWDGQRVLAEIEALSRDLPDWNEAIVRLKITGLRPDVYAAIDNASLNRIKAGAFHADIELRAADPLFHSSDDAESDGDGPLFDDIDVEWERLAATLADRTPEEIAAVTRLGLAAMRGDALSTSERAESAAAADATPTVVVMASADEAAVNLADAA